MSVTDNYRHTMSHSISHNTDIKELLLLRSSTSPLERINVGRRDEPCKKCGVIPPPDEPMHVFGWSRMFSLVTLENFIEDRGILCIRCSGSGSRPSKNCESCGRAIFKRGRALCCHPCEVRYYNARRRRPKQRKTCEVCGESFTAKRSDAKTCSAACKQKAYRQRSKEAA